MKIPYSSKGYNWPNELKSDGKPYSSPGKYLTDQPTMEVGSLCKCVMFHRSASGRLPKSACSMKGQSDTRAETQRASIMLGLCFS